MKVDRMALGSTGRTLVGWIDGRGPDLVSGEVERAVGNGMTAIVQLSSVDGLPVSVELWGLPKEGLQKPLRISTETFTLEIPASVVAFA